MKKVIAIPLAAGVTFLASTAAAQQAGTTFSNSGTFVLSAERLAGLSFTHTAVDDPPDGEDEIDTTEFSLGTHVMVYSTNPFVQPQLGFDYFVIDHLSVGAGLAFWKGSGEADPAGPGPSNDLDDITFFGITPRVGYGMMFTPVIGLWARGGVGYHSFSSDDEDGTDTSEHTWAFTAEGLLMISPIDHFAIELGPAIDIGFGGERETDPANPNQPSVSRDVSYRQIGLVIGLAGWF